jgi:3-oxoacyl-[acyl-carrier-protein] synthase-3
MLQSLGLPVERDYVTFPWLGNTGSVALPVTLALAIENGFVQAGEQVALLGIGSGINSIMLSVQWQTEGRRTKDENRMGDWRPHFASPSATLLRP